MEPIPGKNSNIFWEVWQFGNDSIGRIQYDYENLVLGDDYKGNRHNLLTDLHFKNTQVFINGSSMNNQNSLEDNSFDRLYSAISQQISRFWIGAKYNYEKNLIKDANSAQVDPLSHRFSEIEGFAGVGDSTKVFTEIGYNYRETDSLQGSALGLVSQASTYF